MEALTQKRLCAQYGRFCRGHICACEHVCGHEVGLKCLHNIMIIIMVYLMYSWYIKYILLDSIIEWIALSPHNIVGFFVVFMCIDNKT